MKGIVAGLVGGTGSLVLNDRQIIHPLELDIAVPSCRVAIEYNGIYWHSSNVVKRNYHVVKTMKCKKAGYRLVHVFEHEWNSNKSLCIDFIKKALGHSSLKMVLAEDCQLVEASCG